LNLLPSVNAGAEATAGRTPLHHESREPEAEQHERAGFRDWREETVALM
jgi:hypothetical protein